MPFLKVPELRRSEETLKSLSNCYFLSHSKLMFLIFLVCLQEEEDVRSFSLSSCSFSHNSFLNRRRRTRCVKFLLGYTGQSPPAGALQGLSMSTWMSSSLAQFSPYSHLGMFQSMQAQPRVTEAVSGDGAQTLSCVLKSLHVIPVRSQGPEVFGLF